MGAVVMLLIPTALFAVAALLLRGPRRVVSVAGTLLCVLGCGALVLGGAAQPGVASVATPTAPDTPTAVPTPSPSPTAAPTWLPRSTSSGPGYAHVQRWIVPAFPAAAAALLVTGSLPAHGAVASVVIPATASHFRARPALVYLPPAALTGNPARLPVVIAMSGQSRGAGPADVFAKGAGHLAPSLDALAARFGGLAPIVVVPDQLGPRSANPMCVDSRTFGAAATYVLTDVRRWILTHLPVRTDAADWTVAGYSEGGTCAIQFAAGHPQDFGAVIDVSGEAAPTNGSLQHTIRVGFGGSSTAYLHATPAWLLAHHRCTGVLGYFAVGAKDRRYRPAFAFVADRAAAAGVAVQRFSVPGHSHDWFVGRAGLAWGMGQLTAHWGFPPASPIEHRVPGGEEPS